VTVDQRNRERVQVSMILSAEIKNRIADAAKRDGCSFSQAGEMLIKRALTVDVLLKRLDRLLAEKEVLL
jgi:hypothetical protein